MKRRRIALGLLAVALCLTGCERVTGVLSGLPAALPLEQEPATPRPAEEPPVMTGMLSGGQALGFALEAAGVSGGSASDTEVLLSEDADSSFYEVRFTAGDTDYTYCVDAHSGDILHAEHEVHHENDREHSGHHSEKHH